MTMHKISKVIWLHVIIIHTFFIDTIISQDPGGVVHPIVWEISKDVETNQEYDSRVFNFHPYKYFNEDRDFKKIPLKEIKKMSLFMVFSSKNKSEIGKLMNSDQKVLLTDSTIVSRRTIEYDNKADKPKFISYIDSYNVGHIFNKEAPYFMIGTNDVKQMWYEGGIAEVIIYDRLIDKDQRNRIESYLSLKYGISLPDTSDYFDAIGNKVREADHFKGYNFNVTAIGRDDKGGLNQKQSHNINSDIDLTIGLEKIFDYNNDNSGHISDRSYLFWGDNKGVNEFRKNKNRNDNKSILGRIWQVSTIGTAWENKTIEIEVDQKTIKNFNSSESLWIVTGNTPNIGVDSRYTLMKKNETGKYSVTLKMDELKEGKAYFTFIQAPETFVIFESDSLQCDEVGSKISMILVGNESSQYHVSLYKNNKVVNTYENVIGQKFTINNLEYGAYRVYAEKEGSKAIFQDVYVSRANCIHHKMTNLKEVILPNPVSQDGEFLIYVKEPVEQKLTITTYNSSGQIVKEKTVDVVQDLYYFDHLSIAGTYLIHIRGNQFKSVYKLVVF